MKNVRLDLYFFEKNNLEHAHRSTRGCRSLACYPPDTPLWAKKAGLLSLGYSCRPSERRLSPRVCSLYFLVAKLLLPLGSNARLEPTHDVMNVQGRSRQKKKKMAQKK